MADTYVPQTQRIARLPEPVDVTDPDVIRHLDEATYPYEVKLAGAVFHASNTDGTPGTRFYFKGDVFSVDRTDLEIGLRAGVFVAPDAPLPGDLLPNEDAAEEADNEAYDVTEGEPVVDDLADMVRNRSVADILTYVGDDADLAERALEYEDRIAIDSQRNPRSTLVGPLERIVADANSGA